MSDSRLSPAAAVVLAGVAIGATILVLGLGSWAGTYYGLIRVASIAVALVGLVAWLVVALLRPEHRPASALAGAFAAALFAFAISAWNAPNVRYAVDFLGYAVLLTALYLLFVRVWTSRAVALRLEVLLIVGCFAGGILFIAAIVSLWSTMWTAIGRFVVPPLRFGSEGLWTGTPNAMAAFQVLLYCGVVTALVARGRGGRIAAVVLGAIVAVDVAISGSRGAWLGVGLAVVVTGFTWLATTDRVALRRALRQAWSGRGRVPVIAVAVAAVIVIPAALLVALPRLNTGGADLRASFISASIRMFQAAPLTGQGPGSWAPDRISFTDASEIDYYIPHAHNVPAETLAEFGLVGLVAAVIVVALVVRLIVFGLRRRSGRERGLALAALFACVYITGQQLVDAWIHQPAILFALAVPIARLDAALLPADPGRYRPMTRLLSVVLLVAVVVGTGAALWPERAAQLDLEAVAAADRGDWQAAYDRSTAAAEADPRIAPYHFMRGIAAANLGDLETARDAFEVASADDFPATWINLAAVKLRLGDRDGALESLARGTRLGYQQPQIAVAAAELYRELGDMEGARRMLGAAIATLPSLAADPTWQGPDWTSIWPTAVDEAVDQPDRSQALRVALEAGRFDPARFDAARSIATELAPTDGGLAETVVAAWTGDQDAFTRLHSQALADPTNAPLVEMCRRVARVHDPTLSTPGWACDGGWYFGSYAVASIGDGPIRTSLPGADDFWHGSYAYRRPGPDELLLPWLMHFSTESA